MPNDILQESVQGAVDDLTSWLLDNTENGFEEIPEIDAIRTSLMEALEASQPKPNVSTKRALPFIPANWSFGKMLWCWLFHGGWFQYPEDRAAEIQTDRIPHKTLNCKTCGKAYWKYI